MPLYGVDGVLQKPVGKREHWKLFDQLQGSALHAVFVAEVEALLRMEEYIDSSQAGHTILRKLETQDPAVYQSLPQEQMGGFFGMTLWNVVAQRPEDWIFVPKPNEVEGSGGTQYFRR